jgi:hypothetical protein
MKERGAFEDGKSVWMDPTWMDSASRTRRICRGCLETAEKAEVVDGRSED